jgi:hypothetical protein
VAVAVALRGQGTKVRWSGSVRTRTRLPASVLGLPELSVPAVTVRTGSRHRMTDASCAASNRLT